MKTRWIRIPLTSGRGVAAAMLAAALVGPGASANPAAERGPATTAQAQSPQAIPSHPDQLEYADLEFNPPRAADYRRVLSNGVVAYVVEDHELPLVNISSHH